MGQLDYKKLYQEEYNITWDTSIYDIHHINGKHTDNRIENLLLLPKQLHYDLHNVMQIVENRTIKAEAIAAVNGCHSFIHDWVLTIEEVRIWGLRKKLCYRDPNGGVMKIHGIKKGILF